MIQRMQFIELVIEMRLSSSGINVMESIYTQIKYCILIILFVLPLYACISSQNTLSLTPVVRQVTYPDDFPQNVPLLRKESIIVVRGGETDEIILSCNQALIPPTEISIKESQNIKTFLKELEQEQNVIMLQWATIPEYRNNLFVSFANEFESKGWQFGQTCSSVDHDDIFFEKDGIYGTLSMTNGVQLKGTNVKMVLYY